MKKQVIESFVNLLKQLDNSTPNITSFTGITQHDILRLQISEKVRRDVYERIKKSPYHKEIEEAYLLKTTKNT